MNFTNSIRLALVALVAGSLFGCSPDPGTGSTTGGGPTTSAGPNTKNIGSLDQEVIYTLDEFKKVRKELDDLTKKTEEEWTAKYKGKEGTPEAQRALQDSRMKLQKAGGDKLNPVKRRAEAAIAQVSRTNKMVVVLDKRIVVYGVPEITEDVKKVFQTPGEIKLPDEVDSSKSPVGYFDQEVVRALRVFQEADMKIYKKKMELMKEAEAAVKKKPMTPQDQELLQRELKLKMEAFQESVTAPLLAQVNEAVQEVAKAQGLSLVLDKQHVMQGGRNMTNEVVEAFLKKAGGPAPGKKPAAGSPTPVATP